MADTKTATAPTPLEVAKAAAQKYGKIRVTANFLRIIRRAGGTEVFVFKVDGKPEDLKAYKEVMEQVQIRPDAQGNPRTAYVEDQITGNPLFFLPTATKRTFPISWSSGNPEVNPLGRFVQDDVNDVFDNAIKRNDMVMAEEAKILAARKFGKTGPLSEPRGNSNQSNQPSLSAEETERLMREAEGDAS